LDDKEVKEFIRFTGMPPIAWISKVLQKPPVMGMFKGKNVAGYWRRIHGRPVFVSLEQLRNQIVSSMRSQAALKKVANASAKNFKEYYAKYHATPEQAKNLYSKSKEMAKATLEKVKVSSGYSQPPPPPGVKGTYLKAKNLIDKKVRQALGKPPKPPPPTGMAGVYAKAKEKIKQAKGSAEKTARRHVKKYYIKGVFGTSIYVPEELPAIENEIEKRITE
jgi:hypothetical protein